MIEQIIHLPYCLHLKTEIFHPGSYDYELGKSFLDIVKSKTGSVTHQYWDMLWFIWVLGYDHSNIVNYNSDENKI